MDWLHTTTGTKISKLAVLHNEDRVALAGNITINDGVVLKSQQVDSKYYISIGKYSYIGKHSVITPPMIREDVFSPITIGGYCVIGQNCNIASLNIGNRVIIESDCDLQNLSVIYDCCWITSGTVVPPKLVIPPYSKVSGVPGRGFKIEKLGESYKKVIEGEAKRLNVLGE